MTLRVTAGEETDGDESDSPAPDADAQCGALNTRGKRCGGDPAALGLCGPHLDQANHVRFVAGFEPCPELLALLNQEAGR